MSATFSPYFDAQAHRGPAGPDAYIRVRVPGGPRPDGSILVYLPNGTELVANSNHLLHIDAGPSCPGEPDGRPSAAMAPTSTAGGTPDMAREAVVRRSFMSCGPGPHLHPPGLPVLPASLAQSNDLQPVRRVPLRA